jgi:hypothetical protein
MNRARNRGAGVNRSAGHRSLLSRLLGRAAPRDRPWHRLSPEEQFERLRERI